MGSRLALVKLVMLGMLGMLATVTSAKTTMQVELGWAGHYRLQHWGPIFVTLADDTPRTAEIRVYTSHDEIYAMRVHQLVTLNPTPATFVLYVPFQAWSPDLSVEVRETTRGRRLAGWNMDRDGMGVPFEPVNHLIGISGRIGGDRLIATQFAETDVTPAWVNPAHLPVSGQGYDAFDALILNQPDLSRLTIEQQDAMLEWIRGGGHLICWMGEEPIPASTPLLDVLPAIISENTALQLSEATLTESGLASRFRTLKGRQLMPHPQSTALPLLNGSAVAYSRNLGLGVITLLPTDVSTLLFNSADHSRRFWTPILAPTHPLQAVSTSTSAIPTQNIEQQRRTEASNHAMNLLGDVPGAGKFGFSYVALVMIAMMLLVGPVDWIILKRLGKQPWTWMTTIGWICLFTFGAIYIGYIFKSGDLHYQTLRLIDQGEHATVATLDVAGIYSPRTEEYTLQTQPDGWWEPLSLNQNYYARGRMLTDIDFHQDYRGTRPDPMNINVWNLQFLESETFTSGPPLIEASLRRENAGEGRDKLIGTLKNVGSAWIWDISARVAGGRAVLSGDRLAPGESIDVDVVLMRERPVPAENRINMYRANRAQALGPEILFDLAIDRSMRIEEILAGGTPAVCIYAEVEMPKPQMELSPAPKVEKHRQYVRALLPLEEASP